MSEELDRAQRMIQDERRRFVGDVDAVILLAQQLGDSITPAIGEVSRFDALEALERELVTLIRDRKNTTVR